MFRFVKAPDRLPRRAIGPVDIANAFVDRGSALEISVSAVDADNTVIYTQAKDRSGADSFTYKANDSELDSNIATISLAITPVNDAPVANPLTATLAEDGSIVLNLLGAVSDVDGDVLTLSVANPQSGGLVKNANGSYTYTPAANFNGEDGFSYTVSDGTLSAGNTVRLTITAVNDVAIAVNDTAVTNQGQAVRIDVLGNDSDIDNSTGANAGSGKAANAGLTARVIANPAHGVVSFNADGSLNYTPDAAFYGIDSFTYVASDGIADSNIASVTITVNANATNHPPVAVDDAATLTEDTPVRINLLANDSDPDGDSLSVLLGSNPAHGSVILNADNTVTYTPDHNFSGSDSFTYRASDGQVVSGITTVHMTIIAVADAPTLTLSNPPAGAGRELFRTGWESVHNGDSSSTLVEQHELEGWTLVTHPDPTHGGGRRIVPTGICSSRCWPISVYRSCGRN